MPTKSYYRYTTQRVLKAVATYHYFPQGEEEEGYQMSNLKCVADDEEFKGQMKYAGNELVVVDFYTTWCGPCRHMSSVIQNLAVKYPNVFFLKVDADVCFETALQHDVRGVPLFVIYRNMEILDRVQGAQPKELDAKIAKHEANYAEYLIRSQKNAAPTVFIEEGAGTQEHGGGGCPLIGDEPIIMIHNDFVDESLNVSRYFDLNLCRCMNDLAPSSIDVFLGGKKLISGRGSGKLLIVYAYTEKLNLQSFTIKANKESAPKVLRFYVNHPKVLDFHIAAQLAPSQEVTLCTDDLNGERRLQLRQGSFNNVRNLQVMVMDAMTPNWKSSGFHKVEIEALQVFGTPVSQVLPTEIDQEEEQFSGTNLESESTPFSLDSHGSPSSQNYSTPSKNAANFPAFQEILASLSERDGTASELFTKPSVNPTKMLGALISADIKALIAEQKELHHHNRSHHSKSRTNNKSSMENGNNKMSKRSSSNDKFKKRDTNQGVSVIIGNSIGQSASATPSRAKASKRK